MSGWINYYARNNDKIKSVRPQGYIIFMDNVEVPFHPRYKDALKKWVESKDLSITLEREPNNPVDTNAIKIIGLSKGFFGTKRRHIGYVEKAIAKKIVEKDFADKVYGELREIGINPDGEWIGVRYHLCGLKEFKSKW